MIEDVTPVICSARWPPPWKAWSAGIAVIAAGHPDTIIAARKGSPIAVGIGNGEAIVASDVSAIVNYTNQVIYLDDGDIAAIGAGQAEIVSLKNTPVTRALTRVDWQPGQIEKGGYEHFMLKEIHEQPAALANAIRGRLLEKDGDVRLSGARLDPADFAGFRA